ncbi:MAG: thioesterase family protein [Leeuwenhoekiella sp.]
MLTHSSFIQVRYAETDQMGVVYHGNYAAYLEVARIAWLQNLGISYKKMEENGIILPVYELSFFFHKSAFFDDQLRIETSIEALPRVRIIFRYKIYNQNGDLLTTANSTLVFVNKETGKPTRCPKNILDKLIS